MPIIAESIGLILLNHVNAGPLFTFMDAVWSCLGDSEVPTFIPHGKDLSLAIFSAFFCMR